jgi:hypothetical protein
LTAFKAGFHFIQPSLRSCPLTEDDPSIWTCSVIKAGFSNTLKNTINDTIVSERLATRQFRYFYLVSHPQEKLMTILEEIEQADK